MASPTAAEKEHGFLRSGHAKWRQNQQIIDAGSHEQGSGNGYSFQLSVFSYQLLRSRKRLVPAKSRNP